MLWLAEEIAMGLHARSVQRFGGAGGVRDRGLLLSALARPENILAYTPNADMFVLAAAYCSGIVRNHPFIDGNTRTGVLAAVTFLGLNGIELAFDEPIIVAMIRGLAAGKVSEEALAAWFSSAAV